MLSPHQELNEEDAKKTNAYIKELRGEWNFGQGPSGVLPIFLIPPDKKIPPDIQKGIQSKSHLWSNGKELVLGIQTQDEIRSASVLKRVILGKIDNKESPEKERELAKASIQIPQKEHIKRTTTFTSSQESISPATHKRRQNTTSIPLPPIPTCGGVGFKKRGEYQRRKIISEIWDQVTKYDWRQVCLVN